MLTNDVLKNHLMSIDGVDHVEVAGDGYHYNLTIVSDIFSAKSKVARQQWVYAQLNDDIVSGRLHALTMKTLTKKEWESSNEG